MRGGQSPLLRWVRLASVGVAVRLRICIEAFIGTATAAPSNQPGSWGAENSTEESDCSWAERLRDHAVKSQLHRYAGYLCDESSSLIHFKTYSAEEYAEYIRFLEEEPMYAGHVWDSPDSAFEPIERNCLSNLDVVLFCPQAVSLSALRTASRLLVQARMDRGTESEEEEELETVMPTEEPFPRLVRRACCWKTLHDTIRESLRKSGDVEEHGWPLSLGERHLAASFERVGLDGRRCELLTAPRPAVPAMPSPHELLRRAPRPSLPQLVEAVAAHAGRLPPIIAMVGLSNGLCTATTSMLRERISKGIHAALAIADGKRSQRRADAAGAAEIVATTQQIARAMAEAGSAAKQPQKSPAMGSFEGIAESYAQRALRAPKAGHTCEQLLSGMWHFASPPASRCKHLAAARLMGFAPGDVVLDWGAGCGHGLAWIAAEIGILGIAIDMLQVNTVWALRHTPVVATMASSDYTQAFSLLPEESVDHVISNGVVLNLRPVHQCRLLREQVVRVLRPGGTAWLGYLGISWKDKAIRTTPSFWRACFRHLSGRVAYTIVDDLLAFGTMEHEVYAHGRNSTGPAADPSCSNGCISGAFSVIVVKL